MGAMEPIFVVDVRDRATGKQVAVRIDAGAALLPLGELVRRVLHVPPEELVAAGRLAAEQADTHFRLQDLVFPVDERGRPRPAPYRGLVWRDQLEGFALDPERPALFERVRRADAPDVLVLPLEADRREVGFDRTWRGFHTRRAARFRPQVERLLHEALPGGITLDGAASEATLVEALARRIWHADFENYSRFLPDPIRLKTGDETIENILAGRGGVCTEKVLALKLITDGFGLKSTVVFAGPRTEAPFPGAELRRMLDELDTYDFTYARRYLRYWDHVALEYRLVDGSHWLVDPSNGNIPFLCAPAAPYLLRRPGRRSVPVRVLAVEEPVTYHRAPARLGLDFLFAWETWVADVDLMQVFDNHLGLLVLDDVFVTAALWGSPTKRRVALDRWRAYAREHGLALGLAAPAGATAAEAEVLARFRDRHPGQATWIDAALGGLARRYREYILARYGIDKPFCADLVVLERGREQGSGDRAQGGEAAPVGVPSVLDT